VVPSRDVAPAIQAALFIHTQVISQYIYHGFDLCLKLNFLFYGWSKIALDLKRQTFHSPDEGVHM